MKDVEMVHLFKEIQDSEQDCQEVIKVTKDETFI